MTHLPLSHSGSWKSPEETHRTLAVGGIVLGPAICEEMLTSPQDVTQYLGITSSRHLLSYRNSPYPLVSPLGRLWRPPYTGMIDYSVGHCQSSQSPTIIPSLQVEGGPGSLSLLIMVESLE